MDKDAACGAFELEGRRLIKLLRSIEDPSATAVGKWSIWDTAAHLQDVFKDNCQIARGGGSEAPSIEGIADYNQSRIDAAAGRTIEEFTADMERYLDEFLEIMRPLRGDELVPWTGGIKIPVASQAAITVGECIVHGHDIATGAGERWDVAPAHAALMLEGLAPITPYYIDEKATKGVNATFDLRMRGSGSLYFIFEDGRLSIERPSARRVDVHISADPWAFLLVGYGRIGQWAPVLKGQIFTWGRRPLLALKFGSYIKQP